MDDPSGSSSSAFELVVLEHVLTSQGLFEVEGLKIGGQPGFTWPVLRRKNACRE